MADSNSTQRSSSSEPTDVLILFGPQYTGLTSAYLTEIRSLITETPQLRFIAETLTTIALVWPALSKATSGSGREELERLQGFARGESLPDINEAGNAIIAPLTVVAQLVEFWKLRQQVHSAVFPSGGATRLKDVQGFCIGFLSAAVVASSATKEDFERNAAAAIRIAACIGIVVDSDNSSSPQGHSASVVVKWHSEAERAKLDNTLERYPQACISCITDSNTRTVTLPSRQSRLFSSQLTGLSVQPITLPGRYHHPIHSPAALSLQELFRNDKEFELPGARSLILPLRSNSNGGVIQSGSLHDVALETILTQQCQWLQTVEAAVTELEKLPRRALAPIGTKSFVPRSVLQRINSTRPTPRAGSEVHSLNTRQIAIVGLACRFPEADSVEEFWQLLDAGRNTVQPLPKERFSASELWREPKGPFWGNFLSQPDLFDHRFFNISGREAKSMDPQQRLLLQVAYEAIQSSGNLGFVGDGPQDDIGCYIGVGSVDYSDNVASQDATAHAALGTLRAFISGRLSHFFGWSGPSITYDTACSSAAVAIHSACSALRSGECSVAVAGGVNLITSPTLYQNLAAGSFLNPTGASKAFDAGANGYCRGEGIGLVVLKPLSEAIAAGDFVLGTPVGDPIECESVRRVFGGKHRAEQLFLGSVKDNIGHTESASGVAGLIKTILMIQKGIIPKQANFSRLNPKISPLEPDQMAIPTRSQPWTSAKRVAVVNNYGAAGSNAVLVVEEFERYRKDSVPLSAEVPIFISAKTSESLSLYCKHLQQFLHTPGCDSLESVAYNLAKKQDRSLSFAVSFSVRDIHSLSEKLMAASRHPSSFVTVPEEPPVVLCIGGQSGRTIGLSKALYDKSKLIQLHLGHCDAACRELGLPSIFPTIFETTEIEDIVVLHCALFSIQYASAKCWLDCGLKVDSIIGHSFGQLTALCVAESLSLRDTMWLIVQRAELISRDWGPESGVMLSVEGDRYEVESLIEVVNQQHATEGEIVCYNGPRSHVIAGSDGYITTAEKLQSQGKYAGLKVKRLKNTHAFHSRFVDPIMPRFTELARKLVYNQPAIPIAACGDDDWTNITAEKVAAQTRQPVYFARTVERTARRLHSAVWLEAGIVSPIISMTRRALKNPKTGHSFIPIDLSSDTEPSLAPAMTELWKNGVKAQFWLFHRLQSTSYRPINLPPYQFKQTSHWIDYKAAGDVVPKVELKPQSAELIQLVGNQGSDTLLMVSAAHDMFKLCSEGHAILGHSLCPASLYVELVVRAAQLVSSNTSEMDPHIQRLNISSPLAPGSPKRIFIRLSKKTLWWSFTIFSADDPLDTGVTHANGDITLTASEEGPGNRLRTLNRLIGKSQWDDIATSPSASGLTGNIIYKTFSRVVNYADYYRGVEKVFARDHEAVGFVTTPPDLPSVLTRGVCNPIMIDNFLQVAGIHVNCLTDCKDGEVFMCTAIGEVLFSSSDALSSSEGASWMVYSNFESSSPDRLSNDIFVLDAESGDLVLTIMAAEFRSVALKSIARVLSSLNKRTQNDPPTSKQDPIHDETKLDHNPPDIVHSPTRGSEQCLNDVRKLLSDVMEIPISEVQAESTMVELGVDSLIATEILNEMRARLNIAISTQEFQDISDVAALAVLAQGSVPARPLALVDSNHHQEVQDSRRDTFAHVQSVLCQVLEIPSSDVTLGATLSGLGVDSLMATELLKAIQTSFNVSMMPSDFQNLTDVQSLCRHLEPSVMVFQDNSSVSASEHGTITPVTGIDSPSSATQRQPFAPIAESSFSALKDTFDEISAKTGFAGFVEKVYPAQSELVVSYLVEAFAALGCPLAALEPGSEVPGIPIDHKHAKLEPQLYRILQDYQLIEERLGRFHRTKKPVPSLPAQTLHEQILVDFPQHASEHRLLHTTGPMLADCLSGRADPISLIFGSASARKTLEDVYTNAPIFKSGTILLSQYLVDAFRRFPITETVRVLELGAGTGGTTKYLLDSLIQTQQPFEYTFTDISSSMVAAAKRKFSEHQFMRYSVMDIEKEPAASHLGKYDIVISTNCIHATRNLSVSCQNIKKLLDKDGILCLIELTRNHYWFDEVFGLLEGWWLFSDGRTHALATEDRWDRVLRGIGYRWVDWSSGPSEESQMLRVITASPSSAVLPTRETLLMQNKGGTDLYADVFYPSEPDATGRPVALMIHGGGHIMLSRKDVRPKQTEMLLAAGFLPISIDYRLCPEVTLLDAISDVSDALAWIQTQLPNLKLQRADVCPVGDQVVAVGWSTGGHLAMSLAWAAARPPNAILAFYCPTDYEDRFWKQSNIPFASNGAEELANYDIWEGIFDEPITAYNPPASKRALGGWMSASDARSRIALHMNWKGQTLPMLLGGITAETRGSDVSNVPQPPLSQIQAVSPLAQINMGNYRTPTFIIHGSLDDLIPWEQADRTYQALKRQNIPAEIRILAEKVHLFDLYSKYDTDIDARQAIRDGYDFLSAHVDSLAMIAL